MLERPKEIDGGANREILEAEGEGEGEEEEEHGK
jgi:hypothetical protein